MKVLRLIAINLLVFIGLLGVAFVAIELWARTQPRNVFIEFDPVLGFRLPPDVEGVYTGLSALSPNPNIHTNVRINALGLRGPHATQQKPLGTRRVLVLGDSFVQAFEVRYEDTFFARLERMAQEHSTSPVQVIPMGVMGYGQAQELLWLRDHGKAFEPDVVMLVLFLGNDVVDNSRALNFSGARPYFELEGDSLKLVSLPNSINRYKYWAAAHLRSYLLYKELGLRVGGLHRLLRWLSLDNNAGAMSILPPIALSGLASVALLESVTLAEPPTERPQDPRPEDAPPQVTAAFRLTFALIAEMHRNAAQLGSPFLMAYYGDYPTGLTRDARALTAEFCSDEGLDCVDLNPYIARHERNVVPGDGHWSTAGHRVVAEALWQQWNQHWVGR